MKAKKTTSFQFEQKFENKAKNRYDVSNGRVPFIPFYQERDKMNRLLHPKKLKSREKFINYQSHGQLQKCRKGALFWHKQKDTADLSCRQKRMIKSPLYNTYGSMMPRPHFVYKETKMEKRLRMFHEKLQKHSRANSMVKTAPFKKSRVQAKNKENWAVFKNRERGNIHYKEQKMKRNHPGAGFYSTEQHKTWTKVKVPT